MIQKSLVAILVVMYFFNTRLLTAENTKGFVEICKESDAPGQVTGMFSFKVSGLKEIFIAPVGFCTGPIQLPAGTATLTEVQQPGAALARVTSLPERRVVNSNVEARTAEVTVVAGDISTQTVVIFVGTSAATGFLEICKGSDPKNPVSGDFAFTVGERNVTIPTNGCSGPMRLPTGEITVAERPASGTRLTDIRVFPANRLIASPDLVAGSAIVDIVAGDSSRKTLLTFTNQAGDREITRLERGLPMEPKSKID